MTDDDRELRDLLGRLDPAASLHPADPSRVARLLEDTMADQLTDESRTDGTHHRSRLTWLVAAAAALVIGGGVVFAVTQGDDDTAPVVGAEPTTTTSPPAESVTRLSVAAAAPSTRCLPPVDNPQVVASQTLVFDGTVTSISGSKVTLEPGTYYTGEESDLVVVEAPSKEMAMLLTAVTFEEGGRYLISATDGRVTLCGFSAAYSDDLAAVYAEAFPG